MGNVKVELDPDFSRQIAELFGPRLTEEVARKVEAKAKALAEARAKNGNPLTDHMSFSTHYHGIDHEVSLSVTGRTGDEVAPFLEYGFVHNRTGKFIPGIHVMRDAAAEFS